MRVLRSKKFLVLLAGPDRLNGSPVALFSCGVFGSIKPFLGGRGGAWCAERP
jgi:hypothetical protein